MLSSETRAQSVKRIYLISLALNLVMLSLKLTVGIITGSLVMIADGLDSSLDAVANTIAIFVTRIAGTPPDEDHPYGHRRYETLAAMMVGGFLLLTASEIVQSSISRLLSNTIPEIRIANFAIMALALCVNVGLFRLQRREGKRLRSEVLVASSEDKRSDIMVSITVLFSLVTVQIGMGWMDAVAALVVVVLIGKNALGIIRHAVNVLVDHAALDPASVSQIVMQVPSVEQVIKVKSRGSEDDIQLDLLVQVAASTPVEHSACIADEICCRLRAHFAGLTTIDVNFLPTPEATPDYAHVAQAEAAALGISVHEIAVAQVDSGLAFDAHVEVDGQQTVAAAHILVSRFEERLMHALPELTSVVTHIEPAYGSKPCADCDSDEEHLAHNIMTVVNQLYPGGYWHELVIRTEPMGGYIVSMHCQVKGALTIDEVHQTAEQVEAQLRVSFPEIHRITIHTEPFVSELVKN